VYKYFYFYLFYLFISLLKKCILLHVSKFDCCKTVVVQDGDNFVNTIVAKSSLNLDNFKFKVRSVIPFLSLTSLVIFSLLSNAFSHLPKAMEKTHLDMNEEGVPPTALREVSLLQLLSQSIYIWHSHICHQFSFSCSFRHKSSGSIYCTKHSSKFWASELAMTIISDFNEEE